MLKGVKAVPRDVEISKAFVHHLHHKASTQSFIVGLANVYTVQLDLHAVLK